MTLPLNLESTPNLFPPSAVSDNRRSQHSFLSALLSACLLMFGCWHSSAQSIATQRGAEELTTTLVKALNEGDTALQTSLKENAAAISPQYWQMLIAKAPGTFQMQGADQAFKLYRITLAVAEYLKDEKLIATTHHQIGTTYSLLGKSDEAIRSLLASQKHFVAAGLKRDLIYVLSDLGSIHLYRNDYRPAQEYAEQAVALADELKGTSDPPGSLPDQYGLAGALSTLGALRKREGKYAQAIAYLQRSIALYQAMEFGKQKYAYQLADNFAELGRVYRAMGDNVQALRYLQQALETASKHHRDLRASILNSLGLLYLEQEDYAQAVGYFDQSLATYQDSHNQTEVALVLQNLGVTFLRQEQYELALANYQKSIQQASETDKDVLIAAQQGLGAIYRLKGELKSSLEILNEALASAEKAGDQTRIVEVLWRKAEVQYDLRNFEEAVALSAKAREIARRLELPKLSYLTATMLGRAYLAQRRNDLAQAALTEAIEQIEAMRSHVAGQERGRQLFFEKKVTPYHLLMSLLIEQGKFAEALRLAERAKARVLLDVLSNGRWRPTK